MTGVEAVDKALAEIAAVAELPEGRAALSAYKAPLARCGVALRDLGQERCVAALCFFFKGKAWGLTARAR